MEETQRIARDWFEVKVTITGKISIITPSKEENILPPTEEDVIFDIEDNFCELLSDYFERIDDIDVSVIKKWNDRGYAYRTIEDIKAMLGQYYISHDEVEGGKALRAYTKDKYSFDTFSVSEFGQTILNGRLVDDEDFLKYLKNNGH